MQPSDYYRRNWHSTFMKDAYALENRHRIGVDNLMWSTDYPHHGTEWPYSRKQVREMAQDTPLMRALGLAHHLIHGQPFHARHGGDRRARIESVDAAPALERPGRAQSCPAASPTPAAAATPPLPACPRPLSP